MNFLPSKYSPHIASAPITIGRKKLNFCSDKCRKTPRSPIPICVFFFIRAIDDSRALFKSYTEIIIGLRPHTHSNFISLFFCTKIEHYRSMPSKIYNVKCQRSRIGAEIAAMALITFMAIARSQIRQQKSKKKKTSSISKCTAHACFVLQCILQLPPMCRLFPLFFLFFFFNFCCNLFDEREMSERKNKNIEFENCLT